MSGPKLATVLKVTRAAVSGWERGNNIPKLDLAIQLHEFTHGYIPVGGWVSPILGE